MRLKKPKAIRHRLRPEQVSIKGEMDYIIDCATRQEGRVVGLGPLIFFSTETGDAWVLDPEDNLALCLAREGDPLPVHVKETGDNYSIEWNSMYQIEDDLFTVAERSGRVRTIMGYPTQQILAVMRETGKA